MVGTAVSKSVFDLLERHLILVEEEKERIIEKYFSSPMQDKNEFEWLMNDYIKKVQTYLSEVKVVEEADHVCPFVMIGSIVEVEDLKENELETFQIVSPFEQEEEIRPDYASYLSPIGKALLLKKAQEKVSVETPMGMLHYQIKSIQFPKIELSASC
ncbi:MAG TPA: GreA/GreB family elongation factor [Clostridiales bacterium]|nr:GreA/GreB family elongation factor [Clostridiales bacterium]